ncbi:MAG: GNAT family N-acetyltransferase [Bacteroidaceae bacterium]|nr:GNAT family N-acetyltransferase [Bacteroidaceae bacterium]
MQLIKYTQELATDWNRFVATSKNGTFMLNRQYMDYHSDRFEDCSVMFVEKERVFAVFPANIVREEGMVCSHQGLTYGGMILGTEINAARVLEGFDLLKEHYHTEYGAKTLYYKSIPYIYHRQTSDETEYALYRNGAKLTACGLSSCINLKAPIPYERSRRNALKKAAKNKLAVELSQDYENYWSILQEVLGKRHGLVPVHSAAELRLLATRFPENIKLFVVKGEKGQIIAGTYVYIYNNVVHTQYMTATDQSRHTGALDLLVDFLIARYAPTHQYLDFGISTEQNGQMLNEGLIYQKEGFGGRGVCYNQYEITL